MSAPAITVPQANPGAGYRALQGEIDAAVARALGSGWYILGQELRAFEAEFAAWLGTAAAIGCGNGTDALALALRAMGIGPGMTVVTVSHTAVATVAAIEMVGATPLLVDIEPDHYTMDPAELDEVLRHPPADLPPTDPRGDPRPPVRSAGRAGGDSNELPDAWRSRDRGLRPGPWGYHRRRKGGHLADLATFSFYPPRTSERLATAAWSQRECGAGRHHRRTAAIWLAHPLHQRDGRREQPPGRIAGGDPAGEVAASRHTERAAPGDRRRLRRGAARWESVPASPSTGTGHVFHLYVLRSPERAALQQRLRQAGIGTGIHYPSPVHRQPAYQGRVALGPAGCRATEVAAQQVLSLPIYPELSDEQVEQVCEALSREI
ncbi:MAG: DegT/DnrJ/EryC1/StrS family aminotransferase [Acetobacteraceae bacterium]